jgi:hypothetical protein
MIQGSNHNELPMANIKFEYCYRDGGNYKSHGFEVFSNNGDIPTKNIEAAIKSALIDGEWFYASKWNIKSLHHFEWNDSIDHPWHEFSSIHDTKEPATQGDIKDLLKLITANS